MDLLSLKQNMPDYRQTGSLAKWHSYTFLTVVVKRLPLNVTTLDLHKNFKRFGKINRIVIFENREGFRSSTAEITFKPPPSEAFWEKRNYVKFKSSDDLFHTVLVALSANQFTHSKIKSPVSENTRYDEETASCVTQVIQLVLILKQILYGRSIDFGYLRTANSMTSMTSRASMAESDLSITLNLRKLEIEIHFPLVLQSVNGSRKRAYRFCIALDDKFKTWKVNKPDGTSSFVFHLKQAPRYLRKLENATALSHVPDAKKWYEDDMWSRQTDIVAHKDTFRIINQTPVSVQKNLNSINAARWTTFKIDILPDLRNKTTQKTFEDALKDFNIPIDHSPDFEICYPTGAREAHMWDWFDPQKPIEASDHKSNNMTDLNKINLSFAVRYQLEVCVSQGILSEYDVSKHFLLQLSKLPDAKAASILTHVDAHHQRVFNATSIFSDMKYTMPIKSQKVPDHCIAIRHAIVTATGLLLHPPSIDLTNRIVRKYRQHADRFLRVRFEDEEYRGQTRIYSANGSKMLLIFERVKRVLLNGIIIGDRLYEFLAWGNSQLREHGAYFFAGIPGDINAQRIRAGMGAFDREKVVAKRAARMGQCFSTTKAIDLNASTPVWEKIIPDIVRSKYNFSDGVGKISVHAAELVQEMLKPKAPAPVPSAFQFRLGGCKGVLTLSPDLKGTDIQLRQSQIKFDSPSQELEIIRSSEFWQAFTNRQLIAVLSDLGVPESIFLSKLHERIEKLNGAMVDDAIAIKELRNSVDPNQMTLSISTLIEAGFRKIKEPFVMTLLHLWRASSLKSMKEKANIPLAKGALLLGCVDETATLRGYFENSRPSENLSREEREQRLPEIFVQRTNLETKEPEIIEGICFIARNPSLHRGDVRVVKAVDIPALHHLRDVLVLPQTGDRDLSSMCAGGDLDGDDYIVCWDKDLIPPIWDAEPFHYDAPQPKTASREITTNDIIDFFVDYMQNDSLGRIAHAHLGAADFFHDGIRNNQCLELVQLHSLAVDYAKTGIPAQLPRRLERNAWPHFMEKRGKTYHSNKVLGQLFDAVERVAFIPNWERPFDSRILNAMKPSDEIVTHAKALKHSYDLDLQRIMAQHKIKTEFEVWSTFVISHSKSAKDFKFHEEIGQLSKTLKEQHFQAICDFVGSKDFKDLAPFAAVAYTLTNKQLSDALQEVNLGLKKLEPEEMPFISWPWLLQDTLVRIVISIEERRNTNSRYCEAFVDVDNGTTGNKVLMKQSAGILTKAPNPAQSRENVYSFAPETVKDHLPDPYQCLVRYNEDDTDARTLFDEKTLFGSTLGSQQPPTNHL